MGLMSVSCKCIIESSNEKMMLDEKIRAQQRKLLTLSISNNAIQLQGVVLSNCHKAGATQTHASVVVDLLLSVYKQTRAVIFL